MEAGCSFRVAPAEPLGEPLDGAGAGDVLGRAEWETGLGGETGKAVEGGGATGAEEGVDPDSPVGDLGMEIEGRPHDGGSVTLL